ncbi:MAG: VOC family protein [Candidatus Latescibacteria bacterium]|nr:VOC family protein [Candidatus Latescibacterota bacterium]
MIPVKGISELVLEVRDLQQAERFYGEVLGFPLKRIDPRVTWVEAPQCRIQLRLFGTPGHRGAGPCHFAFAVEPEEIEPITAILKQHGVWARGPVDFGESVSVFCFDPDNNEIEFNDYYPRQAGKGGG